MTTATQLAQSYINQQTRKAELSAMTTITTQQLINGLCDRAKRGAFIVTIEARTDARARKTGNPYGAIYKRSKVNGIANWSYESAVNRQRTREEIAADFEAHPRAWGARIAGSPLVTHKGQMYLELKVQRSLGCYYETADGTPLSAEAVAEYLPAKREDSGRQGVDAPVILRDYAIANILSVTTDKDTYQIVHTSSESALA